MVGNVVMASVWPLGGLAGDTLGLRTAFWAFAGGAAVLAGCALALWWRVEKQRDPGLSDPRRVSSRA
jgi:predicted MFS family arabinose efflux permease